MPEVFLTTVEVGRILGITRQAVAYWIKWGALKHYSTGGRKRVRPEDVIEYLMKINPSRPEVIRMFRFKISDLLVEKYGEEVLMYFPST